MAPGPWLAARKRFDTLYFGRDYTADAAAAFAAAADVERISEDAAEAAAAMIADGGAVAIYTGGMEYGPRALGARSIIANPSDAGINDSLNERLSRSEFMPFAPYCAEEDVDEIFDLPATSRHAARFMTITCFVHDTWRSRIPAVVHVDGTARPQVIRRDDNPLYYDILKSFERRTGLKALINTSFNAHEEPIIDTPAQCLAALRANRIDAVVTPQGLWRLAARA